MKKIKVFNEATRVLRTHLLNSITEFFKKEKSTVITMCDYESGAVLIGGSEYDEISRDGLRDSANNGMYISFDSFSFSDLQDIANIINEYIETTK